MNTKKQVDVCGHPTTIELVALDDLFGDFDMFKQHIRIHKDITLNRKGETLFHEASHSFAPTLSGSELGHSFCDVFTAQGWKFLWDNELIHKGNLAQLFDD